MCFQTRSVCWISLYIYCSFLEANLLCCHYLLILKPATGADKTLSWMRSEIFVDSQPVSTLEVKLLLAVKVTLCLLLASRSGICFMRWHIAALPFLHNINNDSLNDYSKQPFLQIIQLILLFFGQVLLILRVIPSGWFADVSSLRLICELQPSSLLYQGLDYTLLVFLMVRWSWR